MPSYANFNEYLKMEAPNAVIHEDGFTVEEARHPGGINVVPHAQKKPWGGEVWWIFAGRYAYKTLFVDPGQRLSIQSHVEKEETWMFDTDGYVLMGPEGDTTAEVEEHAIPKGTVMHVVTGTKHSIVAKEAPVIVKEVSTTELDDVVRYDDKYGRPSMKRQS